MAAALTVPQGPLPLNSALVPARSLTPRNGVLTLFGYGIVVRVNRGHLVVEDGVGEARRQARFARVGHGLRRLVVIAADGMVSLAALRWLTDQKAAFVMLDRDGSVLVATGPVGPRDARLRRAQALAHQSDLALTLAKRLISQKLSEQERTVLDVFRDRTTAAAIRETRNAAQQAVDQTELRLREAQAAGAYWACWRAIPISFPKSDLPRVPNHWRAFGSRMSALTGSPRLSVNPPNAMLNYLYAIVESEARLAATAMGLDPGLGVMHADTGARDSLAADLMEPVRPLVDRYVLDWLTRHPLRRAWFFELRTGNCRLMASFAERLAQTAPTWAHAVAPLAEGMAKACWTRRQSTRTSALPTRLTQQRRRDVNGGTRPPVPPRQAPPRFCRECGVAIKRADGAHCAACWLRKSAECMPAVAAKGRPKSHTKTAERRRSATRQRNARAEAAWKSSDQPSWLTEKVYREQVKPRLPEVPSSAVVAALNVTRGYANHVRAGRRPHPRHWLALAALVGVSPPVDS